MTLFIALITFAMGCFITYYLDRSLRKPSNTTGIELREELGRNRRTVQELQANTLSLLKIALKTAVDTTAERLRESPISHSEKTQMYNNAYEAIKGKWLEESESLDLDGSAAEGADGGMSPEARIILPDQLDIEPGKARIDAAKQDTKPDFSVKPSEQISTQEKQWGAGESPDTMKDIEPPPEAPDLPTQMEDVIQPPGREKDRTKEPGEEIQELENLD